MKLCRPVPVMVIALSTLLVAPRPAEAQIGSFDKIFDKVTDLNFYAGTNFTSDALRERDNRPSQFGVELIYHLGTRRAASGTPPKPVSRDSVKRTWIESEVTTSQGASEITNKYTITPAESTEPELLRFELGLGYGQISGIEHEVDQYTVTGMVREFPSASAYVTWVPLALYGGVRTGLLQTSGLHAYDASGNTRRANASAFQFGGVVGFAPRVAALFPFIEAGYMFRDIQTIDWGGDVVPPAIPRRLDLSGWQVMFGIQLSLKQ